MNRYEVDPRVEPRVYAAEPDWHRHDFCQVLFGLSGQSELEMDGHLYRTCTTSGVIVPAGCRHDFLGDAENCQLVVDLPLDSIAIPHALLDKPRAFALPTQLGGTLSRLAAACSQVRLRQHDWQLAVHAVGYAVTLLGGDPGDATVFPVMQIEAYLRSHLGHPLSTQALAKHFGWGVRRFHDLFCEAFGDTPFHYQSRLRLDEAVRYMANPALSLAEIAHLLGYADQQTFTRRFSERFGKSPGRWRRLEAGESLTLGDDRPANEHAHYRKYGRPGSDG